MATKKIKVSQKTIDQIKNLGMTKALAAGKTVKSAQFQEGLRRMYGAARVNKALGITGSSPVKMGGGAGRKSSSPVRLGGGSGTKNKVVKRNAAGKVVNRQSFADLTPAQQKAVTAKMKADRSKTSRTIGKVVGTVAAPFGPVGAAAAIYGTRDFRKKKKK